MPRALGMNPRSTAEMCSHRQKANVKQSRSGWMVTSIVPRHARMWAWAPPMLVDMFASTYFEMALLLYWPPYSQQVFLQRWIWGIHCTQVTKHASKGIHPGQMSPEVGDIIGPTKRTYVLQNLREMWKLKQGYFEKGFHSISKLNSLLVGRNSHNNFIVSKQYCFRFRFRVHFCRVKQPLFTHTVLWKNSRPVWTFIQTLLLPSNIKPKTRNLLWGTRHMKCRSDLLPRWLNGEVMTFVFTDVTRRYDVTKFNVMVFDAWSVSLRFVMETTLKAWPAFRKGKRMRL